MVYNTPLNISQKLEGKGKKKETQETIVIMTRSRVPPGIIEMTENLVMEEIGGRREIPEIGGRRGNPETLETPEMQGIIAEITKIVVIKETHVPPEILMTTETEKVGMPIKRMTSIRRTHAAMEDPMAERRALVPKQGMTPEVTLEMTAEVIERAEVEVEVQSYLTKVLHDFEKKYINSKCPYYWRLNTDICITLFGVTCGNAAK